MCDNERNCKGIIFNRNYFGGHSKCVCEDHSKCLTHECALARHYPEGTVGLLEGLKKKVTQLQYKKKPAMKLNKKKEKDYYCLMLRKINGLDRKIQNLESLFVNYFDRDLENSICVNECSSRKFDYTDIYSAVRSLTNLTNQLKEELLNTQNRTINCDGEDTSRLYDKIKFLETELRNLYQHWDYYQNITDRKRVSENGRASLKERQNFNNIKTCNFPKDEENTKVKRNTDCAARNYPEQKTKKCKCNTELCNLDSDKDSFTSKIDHEMFEDCKNLHCDRQCPIRNSCSDRICSNESLCSGNDFYHYKNKYKSRCHKCDGGKERNIRRDYNVNTNENKCKAKNCYQDCGICGSTAIESNFYQSNKAPQSKKRAGVNDRHKLMYNDSEESLLYAQPRKNNYNDFRRRNIDVRDMKQIKGEIGPCNDKPAFKKNNNRNRVFYYSNEHYPKNQGSRLEPREKEISSDSSDGESYCNLRSCRSPRGRIKQANNRVSYCDCMECDEEKTYHPPRQRNCNKNSNISLHKNKDSTCYRGCKECDKNSLNKNIHKNGYNAHIVKDRAIESIYNGNNKKNKHRHFNNTEKQRKQRFKHNFKKSEQRFNDLADYNEGSPSEEMFTPPNIENGHRANHNLARDHIHVTLRSEQQINRREKNYNKDHSYQDDLIEQQSLIDTKKSKENTRLAYRNKNSPNKTKNKGVRHYQGKGDSRDDSETSLKSAKGGDNTPLQSKVYFCKDSECDNLMNKEEIIVWLNSEQNNITESVFNKIVEIVRDFNTHVCDKCIIKSQHLKVDPKNTKYANKKTKILLNKEVLRCNDCRKNLEDQISNLIEGRQMNYLMNRNRTLEHNLEEDNLIIEKKVSLDHNIKLNLVNGRKDKSPFSQEIDCGGKEIVVPVYQTKANEKDPFKVYGSVENDNSTLTGISNNTSKNNPQLSPIKRDLDDNFNSSYLQKKSNAEILHKSTENNYNEGESSCKKVSNHSTSQENAERMKQKSKLKEQNYEKQESQSKMFTETNVRTKFVTVKPKSPNHKDYHMHTSVNKSPFYLEQISDENIPERYNSVRQSGQNKNKKRKSKKSTISLNSEGSSRIFVETKVDPPRKQPIVEKVQIKSTKKDHSNKQNKQFVEKNDYTKKKQKEINRPSHKFSDDCKFILPVKKDFNNSSSIVTSSQENFRNSARHSNRNFRKDFEYNSGPKTRNPLRSGVQRYAIVYPELSNEFQINSFHDNRGKTNKYCKNTEGNAEMGRYRFKSFTITSDSSFSFMDWENIANKLKK